MSIEEILVSIRKTIANERELEYFLIHQDRYRIILQRILRLKLPQKAKILDVGCYPPHLFNALLQLGYQVWGISSKHEPLSMKNVSVLNIEIEKLPLENHFFDCILFSEIMEHLLVNPLIYLEKLRKVLKKSGTLLITTPNAAGLHKRIPLLFGRSSYFPLSELYATNPGDQSVYYRHNREYTKNELIDILTRSNFDDINVSSIAVYGPFREKLVQHKLFKRMVRGIAYYITVLIPPLRDTLYVEARS